MLVLAVAVASFQGVGNLVHQWSIQGEFSNLPQEQLVDWINENTPQSKGGGGGYKYWGIS